MRHSQSRTLRDFRRYRPPPTAHCRQTFFWQRLPLAVSVPLAAGASCGQASRHGQANYNRALRVTARVTPA
jgi:hypothetical protein